MLFVALFTFGLASCGSGSEPNSSDEVDSLNASKLHDAGGQIPDAGPGQTKDAGPGGGEKDSGAEECDRASDCTGAVPNWCTECDAGNGGTTESCAHNACVHHQCEIVICQ